MQTLLAAAIELHQAGQIEPAAQLYQQVLAQERGNADALHLLGVVRHQQGDHASAVKLIGQAVACKPSVAPFHANLAEAYRALGQFARAAGCCRTALRLAPDYPEALVNLGLALAGQGQHEDAVAQYRRALELRPEFAAAHSNLGVALRELKQFDEALEHFRRAVALCPDYAPALTNLGQMLVDRGEAEEALPHCREAVRLQPDLAALHHNLGNALRALDRPGEARAEYLEAIRLDPNLARAHAHLGLALQQEGELGEALTWLKQAVAMEPQEPDFWELLAALYAEREETADAIRCWEQALALDPDRASAHDGLGRSFQDDERPSEAVEQFRTALQLQPDLAAAQLGLGSLHEELGDLAAAETAFREALRLQPKYALPLGRLATLLRGKLPDADRTALEERLAEPKLGEGPRTRLLFGLAHVLDARGEYARAADCLRRANALTRDHDRCRQRAYEPAEHAAFVDRLIAAFGPEFFARLAGAGSTTRRPVFVFGLPRSGTTLVEQVLASHSRVHGAGELRLARQSFDAIPGLLGRAEPPLACLPHLAAAALRHLADQHAGWLQALGGGAERVVDKMPDNYLYVGLLAALFPHALFIHCRRDLRDVAASCWMTDFRSIRWASRPPADIASRFGQYRRMMDHWQQVLPVPVHAVDYEEAVVDLEGVARRLLAASGLDWEPACLDFHRSRRPVRTASVAQVRQPVYTRSVARWKHYENELADLFAALPKPDAAAS